jgi:hypothetical protein
MPHRLSLRPTGKHRKQRASDYSVTINGLMTRRSLLLSEKPDTLADDLAAIDCVLKLCGFNEDPQQYMPERRKKQIFAKGEKRRLVRQVLEQSDKSLTSREICLAILADKDFDFTDKRRLNQTTVGVYNFLCCQHQNRRVDKVEGWPVRWVRIGVRSKNGKV